MSNKMIHPFHLVDESPWPLAAAIFSMGVVCGAVSGFYSGSMILLMWSGVGVVLVSVQWWRDVSREGSNMGSHSTEVELGLRWGMILFIISEVMLFFSFFWAYFHVSLGPSAEIGAAWPPMGVSPMNPKSAPLLNSIILLSSGAAVTWAHHGLVQGKHLEGLVGLSLTIIFGSYFTGVQGLEYLETDFSLGDSSYGSSFFLTTGFHGVHVLVGTLFLMTVLGRVVSGKLSPDHHLGFEAAAWYWHFVDVVWLFLYLMIYWWGSLF